MKKGLAFVGCVGIFVLLAGSVQRPALADGNPQPPVPPKPIASIKVIADGNPQPPLPKKPRAGVFILADKNPQPPLPPKKPRIEFVLG